MSNVRDYKLNDFEAANGDAGRKARIARWAGFLMTVLPLGAVVYALNVEDEQTPAVAQTADAKPMAVADASAAVAAAAPVAAGDAANEDWTAQSAPPLTRAYVQELARSIQAQNPGVDLKPAEPVYQWTTAKVRRGDNLSKIFARHKIKTKHWYGCLGNKRAKRTLTRLHPGDTLEFRTNDQGYVAEIRHPESAERTLQITRQDNGDYTVSTLEFPLERRLNYASGEIGSSLFKAARTAGLSDNLTMELTNIFAWDVDFALDIRQGDQFTVIFEEYFRDGEKVRDGKIMAAEFMNRDNTHRAIRFTNARNEAHYYTPEGNSIRKAFIRTPVDFARISSRFNLRRRHPVLNRIRAHKGVDYAAPTGTPIKSTGSGRVVFRGVKRGYGKVVIVQHGQKYSTLYGHMSKFNKDVRTGSRVQQGQVIGYVGATGLATGPHLHYEFRVGGRHVNPLTVALPKADPISKRERLAFNTAANPLIARLDSIRESNLITVASR